jgi:hypothetical protein
VLKRLLQKKILKIIPLWFILILVAIPACYASYNWISNQIQGTINVTAIPAEIHGTFTQERTSYETVTDTFTYTINSPPQTGYVYLKLQGPFTSASDCKVNGWVAVQSGDQVGYIDLTAVGTPVFTDLNGPDPPPDTLPYGTIEYVLGHEGSALNFATAGTEVQRTIQLSTTIYEAGSVTATIQLTSSANP